MRLIALALMTALAAPAAAAAQDQPLPPLQTRTGLPMQMPALQEDSALLAAIASPARPAADSARDVFRHPYESLTFWGLQPGQTVVEIEPGRAGWWTGILQPYLSATGGKYVAVSRPVESMGVEDGSADMILVARAFHNWSRSGRTEPYLAAFFRALKPGGILAVEQHRSAEGRTAADVAHTGYVPESYVIAAAEAAGFVLEARSDLNANSADDHVHPYGVWTLPPTRVSAPREGVTTDRATPLTAEERAAHDAIGESDRMTLRFRKPE